MAFARNITRYSPQDEAQELLPTVLAELRLLATSRLDSHTLLTTLFAGDARWLHKLRTEDFAPLDSRMRVRLNLDRTSPAELEECLQHVLEAAGAPRLMTHELVTTLCEHASGNLRALMNMAGELLAVAAQREARQIDEKLFLEVFALSAPAGTTKMSGAGRRR